ncbi:MAG: glycosyltransferase family 39 protein [Cyanobacteria bacterium J06632_3]
MATSSPVPPGRRDIFYLLGWAGLLIVCSQFYPSLMAHDEGNYALESRFMLESGEWLARQSWGVETYSHGILLNWLMMVGYQLFGVGDQVSTLAGASWAVRIARLPTMLACLGTVMLTYDIGRLLFARQRWRYAQHARRLGLLSGLLLMVFTVWTQYSHLGTQDMLLVSVELLGVWSLLKAEQATEQSDIDQALGDQSLGDQTLGWQRFAFGFLAGAAFGLGYLIKTFMIVLPAIALLPYLIFENRRHRHLLNLGLYVGLVVGLLPAVAWIALSVAKYGDWVLVEMFGKVGQLNAESFHPDGGPFYYLWNIPANMVPWCVFAVIGIGMVLCQKGFWHGLLRWGSTAQASQGSEKQPYPHRWLFLFPLLMLGMLTVFTTKTAYYTLQLHPWLAFYSAIALHTVATQRIRWPRHLLSYSFAVIGVILLLLPVVVLLGPIVLGNNAPGVTELFAAARPYAPLPIFLGGGWVCLPFLMQQPQKWIGAWLLSAWLTLCAVGLLGFFGNYSADVKTAMTTPPIAPILQSQLEQSQPINFLNGPNWPDDLHKSMILVAFHTPLLGQLNPDITTLPAGSYVWVSDTATQLDERLDERLATDAAAEAPTFETIARVRQWRLVRL